MTGTMTVATKSGVFSESLPLQGRIEFQDKESGTFGTYIKDTYVQDGKIYHTKVYIGKAINKEKGIFYSKKRGGLFSFTLEKGFDLNFNEISPDIIKIPSNIVLHFGDVWMIDQIYKQTGIETILDNLIPGSGDALKALVAYKLTNRGEPYLYAHDWYRRSYAGILYPSARLESPRISEFLSILGEEKNYRSFFTSYFPVVLKNNNMDSNHSFPILIDSTGLPNDMNNYLTSVNNHNGVVSNEIRLIYVVDKISKLPIFFRYVPGNIIDNSTLITTINMLKAHYINVELVIMDAGYFSYSNLEELLANNIDFLTRMNKNRKEYKQLMTEHGNDLMREDNAISYSKRALCVKKVQINLFNRTLYAFIMLDLCEYSKDLSKSIIDNNDNDDKTEKCNNLKKGFQAAGRFILLSSIDYETNEILELYYNRQTIEQVFDIGKNYCGLLPVRVHSEETFRGILLISFIASVIYSFISAKLPKSQYSAHGALKYMHNSLIKIYDTVTILEDFTKQQNDIFKLLNLDCPFMLEKDNPLQKKPFCSVAGKNSRGRPKGSKNKLKLAVDLEDSQMPERRLRGRPKGSKNKPKPPLDLENSQMSERRLRGRPKGSKNKPKPPLDLENSQMSERRLRGRPKGSKNKSKLPLNL